MKVARRYLLDRLTDKSLRFVSRSSTLRPLAIFFGGMAVASTFHVALTSPIVAWYGLLVFWLTAWVAGTVEKNMGTRTGRDGKEI